MIRMSVLLAWQGKAPLDAIVRSAGSSGSRSIKMTIRFSDN